MSREQEVVDFLRETFLDVHTSDEDKLWSGELLAAYHISRLTPGVAGPNNEHLKEIRDGASVIALDGYRDLAIRLRAAKLALPR